MAPEFIIHLVHPDDGVRLSLSFILAMAGFSLRFHDSVCDLAGNPGDAAPGCLVVGRDSHSPSEAQCLRELRSRGVRLPVIFVAAEGDVQTAVAAMKAGAADFLQMPFEPELLISAVRSAMPPLSEDESDEPSEIRSVRERMSRLTPREMNVLRGVVDGLPNKSIASELRISPRTVEVHRANVMAKMNARSVAELVRLAMIVDGDVAISSIPPGRDRGASITY